MARVTAAMSEAGKNAILRCLRKKDETFVAQVKSIASSALSRLGQSTSYPRRLVSGLEMPDGSDQVDVGSFKTWAEGLPATDTDGIEQLRLIHATAVYRQE